MVSGGVGVCLTWCGVRRSRGFHNACGSPIRNRTMVLDLLEAMILLSALAIVKVAAHTYYFVSMGNTMSDDAAKLAASKCHGHSMFFSATVWKYTDLASKQALDVGSHLVWKLQGCRLDPVSKTWRQTVWQTMVWYGPFIKGGI